MPRQRSATLTDAELRLMSVLWKKGEATVSEVVEALPARQRPAYNSVLTILRILEDKGYVAHSKEGRAHLFRPLVTRTQAQGQALKHMLRRFFDGSPSQLMNSVLASEELSDSEIDELRAMIERAEDDVSEGQSGETASPRRSRRGAATNRRSKDR
jgi:predicted transcriptional regulator